MQHWLIKVPPLDRLTKWVKHQKENLIKKNNFNIDLYTFMLLSLHIFSATNYTEIIYLWIYYFYLWYFTLHLIYSTNIRTIKFEFHILSPSAEKWVWIEPDFSSFYCHYLMIFQSSATNVFSMRSDLEYHPIRTFFFVVGKSKGNFSTATVNRVSETNPNRVSVTQFTTSSSTTIFVYL